MRSILAVLLVAAHSKVVDLKATAPCLQVIAACAQGRPLTCYTVCEEQAQSEATGLALTEALSLAMSNQPLMVPANLGDTNKPLYSPTRALFEVPSAAVFLARPTAAPYNLAQPGGIYTSPLASAGVDTASSPPPSPAAGPYIDANAMQAVGEALLNDEAVPGALDLLGSMNLAVGTEAIVGVPNGTHITGGVAGDVTVGTCQRICVDDRIQNCVLENVCHEAITVTERWNVTHYCLANNGTVGGWGFRVPLAVAIDPTQIQSLTFESEIFPATHREHVAQGSSLNLTLAISEDAAPRAEDTLMRHCAIENIAGIAIQARLQPTGLSDNSRLIKIALTNPEVPASADFKLIKGDTLLISIVGPIAAIANGGLVPPPFDKTTFTLTHVMNF